MRCCPFTFTGLALCGLLLTLSLGVGEQVRPKTKEEVAKADVARADVAKGKPLVTKLPAGVEGVEIAEGAIKLKAGYQFVEDKKNRTVAVQRTRGRLGNVGGSWSCSCSGGQGACDAVITAGTLTCVISAGSKCPRCDLTVSTPGIRGTAIIRY